MFEYLSADYDNEIKIENKLANESLIAISSKKRGELSENYFKFYCISKSLKRVKRIFFNQH